MRQEDTKQKILSKAPELAALYSVRYVERVVRYHAGICRAVLYYITIALLLLDPLYLSVLCGLFGGGDMNGIARLFPE